ncbi:MAG: MCE family protein, partial [Methyloprofundus sp.]|nr:MCE family protein [Methyloprofundus sp.]
KISIIWLVPIVAILIGVWIGYRAWSEIGPTITITFDTADGLEAGKTKVKYKNVEIGEVTAIHLNHESMNVEVIAEMKKDIKPFLTDKSRFWVVRARINASGASGLDTLLSGAYIGVDPSSEGHKIRKFKGLEIPPVITGKRPGKHFVLHTDNLGSIERDTPVYYRKFNVGRVEDVKLNSEGESVTVKVFVNEPYDQWVHAGTKFWNASGVEVSMNANGINVDTESLVSLLIGGIAFESGDLSAGTEPVENNAEFELYANRMDSLKIDYKQGIEYVVNFSESVRGLKVGAPVEFRGIQLGEVTAIRLSFDDVKNEISVLVTMTINYERFVLKGVAEISAELSAGRRERTDYLIKKGVRAQLDTGNLLTGQLYISLDFFPDATPFVMDWTADIPEFPSAPGTMGVLKVHLGSILKKVDTMMTQVEELSYKLNHNLEPELSVVLKQAKNTLVTIQGTLHKADGTLLTAQDTLKNDSPLQQDLQGALREFSKAARSIKILADYLERHPESLIQGKTGD